MADWVPKVPGVPVDVARHRLLMKPTHWQGQRFLRPLQKVRIGQCTEQRLR